MFGLSLLYRSLGDASMYDFVANLEQILGGVPWFAHVFLAIQPLQTTIRFANKIELPFWCVKLVRHKFLCPLLVLTTFLPSES